SRDWSSDVCSSDLEVHGVRLHARLVEDLLAGITHRIHCKAIGFRAIHVDIRTLAFAVRFADGEAGTALLADDVDAAGAFGQQRSVVHAAIGSSLALRDH